MDDLPSLIRAERIALIEVLETLEPQEWSTQSLCGAWTVQGVAAHLAWAPVAPVGETLAGLAKAGFRLNKASADMAVRAAERGPEAILAQLRANAAANAKPRGVPEIAALVDAVIHALDIRLPLGKPRPVPVEAFHPVADFSTKARWPMTVSVGGSARKRLAGVQLVAEGYDWSYGQGPEVRAAGDAVLRILNGRRVEREELTGPGADQLHAQVSP
ncbi:maleylpyruvate isomerase family mycothiol-dependent enzyme [Kribbella sancticallisti]|uniref:Maleylpyruvate isomerase family mycothiol-dependent enzyme n=1 Tax=Kribbella sancticallisti TaxID=460087 RepID=A0ABN2DEA0_9ACTN